MRTERHEFSVKLSTISVIFKLDNISSAGCWPGCGYRHDHVHALGLTLVPFIFAANETNETYE